MKIILIFFSLILILSGCSILRKDELTDKPLNYMGDLEELANKNIEFRCSDVGGGTRESFDIAEFGCDSKSIYINYNEEIMYTVFDNDNSLTNELTYDRKLYRFYDGQDPEIAHIYKTKTVDEELGIYKKVYRVLTFLAMLDGFDQEIGEEVVYEEKDLHWEELANYYSVTLRNETRDAYYKDVPCRVTKIAVTRKSENTIVVKTEEEACEDDDGEEINDTDEIEVTINVDEDKFIGTYNDLLRQVKNLK